MATQYKKNGIPIIRSNLCSARKEKLDFETATLRADLLSSYEGWLYNCYLCPVCHTYHIGHAFPRVRLFHKERT